MSLIVKQNKNYDPAPEGVHNGVCVDVVDMGMVTDNFGTKHKCRLAWELDEKMTDGRPFLCSKTYTVSLNEKSSLYKDLKAWRGVAFTKEELAGFDLEKVIGAPCQIVIQHVEKDGTIYANVQTIIKSGKERIKPSGTYVRVKDRDVKAAAIVADEAIAGAEDSDECPF